MALPPPTEIISLHTDRTQLWHTEEPACTEPDGFLRLVEENHLRNFQLWHEEDIARRDDLGFEAVYRAKRAIDGYNQQRNDFMEKMDQACVAALHPAESGVPFNSETPGMMVDRLSILALKEFHMQEQADRGDADPAHRRKCADKVAVLQQQRADLARALADLLEAVEAGERSFRVYFQFKMYNDPSLNPELYGGKESAT
jgi:hypothetical protein